MFIPAVPGLTMFGSEKPSFSLMAFRLFLWYASSAFSPKAAAQLCINFFFHSLFVCTAQVRPVLIFQFFKNLRELSVFCIFPGSKSLLGKFKNHPDREVRKLASTLPGLILQDLAPSSVKKYQSTLLDG